MGPWGSPWAMAFDFYWTIKSDAKINIKRVAKSFYGILYFLKKISMFINKDLI